MRLRLPVLAFVLGMATQALAAGAIVAWVNSEEITLDQLIEQGTRVTPEDGKNLTLEQKEEVLDYLIEQELLYQEAKRKGYEEDPKVKKVMVNELLRQEVYSQYTNSDFTEAQLKTYFEEHMDEFIVPEKVQVKTITLKIGEQDPSLVYAKAQDIYQQLERDPARFSDIASAQSEDPYRRRGGDLGFVSREGKPGVDIKIIDAAFAGEVGEVQAPLRVEDTWVIILPANKREKVERTYEQMKGSVLRKVKNEALKAAYDGYVAELETKARVKTDKTLLRQTQVLGGNSLTGGPGGQVLDAEDPFAPADEP